VSIVSWPILLALGLLAVAVAIQLRMQLRLHRLAAQARQLVALAGQSAGCAGANAAQSLSTRCSLLQAALAKARGEREEQLRHLEQIEERVQENKERYALAVQGAGDGMWEWNPITSAAHFSARWKGMLGYAEDEIGGDIDAWRERIHPEDREPTWRAMEAHLAGESARFESEHRLRHRDGRYRWMLTRAQAVHRAGVPHRLVGLNTDISERRQVQEILLEVADGLSGLSGEACYRALVRMLAGFVDGNDVMLTQCCNTPPTRVRMLARWTQGHLAECREFDLAETPCETVIHSGKILFVPGNAGERWPREKLIYATEGYLGLPCLDTRGKVIGHIACKSRAAMRAAMPHQAILKLFSVRAAVEIERQWLAASRAWAGSLDSLRQ
jgi:PAS domain S-box-containing protein